MPPPLATLITLCFCAYMLWREQRLRPHASSALWLPFIWMFFACSRFPAQWLVVLGIPVGFLGPSADGTPIDAMIFLSLTLLGVRVLSRRGFHLADFVRDNRCITIFLVYCFLAVLWSDMPFVSFKRWIKILGHPVMALVILTDRDPVNAIRTVLRKTAFLLLPLSLLFIRYYPHLGRSYDYWTGIPFVSGVTTMKNSLGAICFLYALFFCWDVVMTWKGAEGKTRKTQLIISGSFLGLAFYLLDIAESATSLACFILGAVTFVVLGTRLVNPRNVGPVLIAVLIVAIASDALFGIREVVIHMLGRNTTLTDRTDLWKAVLAMPNSVMFGAGFESFWSGARLNTLAAKGFGFNQAHNGYIDTYLNLGAVGLLIVIAWIVVTFRKIQSELIKSFDLGRFGLAFLVAIVAYNYTEAAFIRTHPVWTIFFLISIRFDSYRLRTLSRAKVSKGPLEGVSHFKRIPVGAAYLTRVGATVAG